MSQMSKDITPSVQVLGLSQAVPSKDMSRPNINTAPPIYSTPLEKFHRIVQYPGGILHLSRDPVIRFEPSFFCLIALIELFKIKKKIAQIGPVDREIFAKNGIFKFYLVPEGNVAIQNYFLKNTQQFQHLVSVT